MSYESWYQFFLVFTIAYPGLPLPNGIALTYTSINRKFALLSPLKSFKDLESELIEYHQADDNCNFQSPKSPSTVQRTV